MVDVVSLQIKADSSQVRRADKDVKGLGGAAKTTSGLIKGVGAALAAIGVTQFARSVFDAGVKMQTINNTMKSVTGTFAGAAREIAFVRQESERLGLDLGTAAQGYAQISAAAKGTNITMAETREIFTAISEASTVLGMSAEDTAGALLAVNQVISKGKVQAEELRGQLGERIPGAFQMAARAMNMTTAELSKQLELGKVYSDDFIPKFAAEIRKTFGKTVPDSVNSARAALNRFNTAIFELQVQVSQGGFLDAVTSGLKAATEALKVAGRYLDEFVAIITLASIVLVSRFAVSVVSSFAAVRAATMGAVAESIRYQTALAGMAGGASIASIRLATLSMTMRTAFALAGGPVGLIVMAVATLFAFREETVKIGNVTVRVGGILDAVWKTVTTTIEMAISNVRALWEILSRLATGDFSGAMDAFSGGVDRGAKSVRELVDAWKSAFTEVEKPLKPTIDVPDIPEIAGAPGGSGELSKLQVELARVADETIMLNRGYTEAQMAAIKFAKANDILGQTDPIDDATLAKVRELTEAYEGLAASEETAAKKAEDQARRANNAFKRYADAANDNFANVDRFHENMFRNMEDSLVEFVKTGKMSFRDFADSIISELIRIQVRQSILGPLSGMMNGSGGIGSIFGSLFGGGGSSVYDTAGTLGAFGPSFDGGGYTGGGARSGGLDGKGGFMAMLHPRETVVDHTRGQSLGGNVTINNYASDQVDIQTKRTGGGGLELTIDKVVAKKLGDRGSSSNRSLRNNFNAKPQLASR